MKNLRAFLASQGILRGCLAMVWTYETTEFTINFKSWVIKSPESPSYSYFQRVNTIAEMSALVVQTLYYPHRLVLYFPLIQATLSLEVIALILLRNQALYLNLLHIELQRGSSTQIKISCLSFSFYIRLQYRPDWTMVQSFNPQW